MMKPSRNETMRLDDELDLLVAGELREERRAELWRRLDEEDDGWKRCALGFLEAQAWRDAMAAEGEDVSAKARRRWATPAVAVAAALLGFLAAVALVQQPSPAAVTGGPPVPVPETRLIAYPVVEHTGFVPARDERGNRYYQARGDVPAFFLDALREAGHDVRHVERTVAIPRDNGEPPLELPVTETRVFVNYTL